MSAPAIHGAAQGRCAGIAKPWTWKSAGRMSVLVLSFLFLHSMSLSQHSKRKKQKCDVFGHRSGSVCVWPPTERLTVSRA